MSTPRDTPFSKVNSKTQYGRTPLESWVGTVVSYDKQKEQIEAGWGWRYKVRIMGDNTQGDQITDDQLNYAYVLLPTTAGSGGAFKMRSVRISQGDFVYGVRGGGAGAPTMILGVFPRTSKQSVGDGKFANLSGFSGSLNSNTGILSGEFNEQTAPQTPGTTPVNPKNYNKSNKSDTSEKLSELGYDRNLDGKIDDAEKKLVPPRVAQDKKFDKGDPITSQQLKYILRNPNFPAGTSKKVKDEHITKVNDALNQAITQNLISKSLSDRVLRLIKRKRYDQAINIAFPPETPFSEEPAIPV